MHASPDAPAVDIAVQDGPVLFSDVAFKEVGSYLPVDAGTYDLEARVAGTDTVALEVPDVTLQAGGVYTVFAMGLVEGEPALQAVPSLDSMMPADMPETGAANTSYLYAGLLFIFVLALVLSGIAVRKRLVPVKVENRS